jgi:hypothetical protein
MRILYIDILGVSFFSWPWSRQLSRDVPADVDILCNEWDGLRDSQKGLCTVNVHMMYHTEYYSKGVFKEMVAVLTQYPTGSLFFFRTERGTATVHTIANRLRESLLLSSV